MYQRILVPVDGSKTSNLALQEAVKIAKQHGSRIKLVHVIEDVRFFDVEGMIDYATLQDMAKRSGEQALTQAKDLAQSSGITAETALLESGNERTEEVIIAESLRWLADLLVIGTHGRSGVSRMLFGSVAEGVVRGATIPVLLIRGE